MVVVVGLVVRLVVGGLVARVVGLAQICPEFEVVERSCIAQRNTKKSTNNKTCPPLHSYLSHNEN